MVLLYIRAVLTLYVDFDPEENRAPQSSDDGSDFQDDDDDLIGTEHYVEVGCDETGSRL
jgi:hypothetical protein